MAGETASISSLNFISFLRGDRWHAVPVVAAETPFLCASDGYLRRLAIIKIDVGVAFECVVGRGKIDNGADQFTTATHIKKGHILSSYRMLNAGVGGVECSPPRGRVGKWLVAHIPGD